MALPDTTFLHDKLMHLKLDECPDYDSVVSRSNSGATNKSVHWRTASDQLSSTSRPPSDPPIRRERYLYTYSLLAASTPLQFLITVEPVSGKPEPGEYTFKLSFRANGVERSLGEPIIRRLHVDPRSLNFAVFVFPGKTSIPPGSLWSFRVWLRVSGIDHRLFGGDDLWVGKDLDFNTVSEASFARLKSVDARTQLYHGFVGKALVTFIIRWQRVYENMYKYAMAYEASGVGGSLFDDIQLRIDGDPRTVTFLIYTVPIASTPIGASHRIRVWIKSLINISADEPTIAFALPFNDSHIYQRIWKSDIFKVGARLDFQSLGSKTIMGFSSGGPQTIVSTSLPDVGRKPSLATSQTSDKSTRNLRWS